jgi:uncharacterized surface protein with fasciclin (FAS1) repeats
VLTAALAGTIVPGKVMAADVIGLTEAQTVQGQALPIDARDGVHVADAGVVQPHIHRPTTAPADNGPGRQRPRPTTAGST